MATCCDAESDGISEEIELLEAIYINELEIHGPQERPTLVNLFLHPSTGDDDHDSKYVCLNLLLSIPEKYPFHPPGISIKNPRGLSDAHITSIQDNLIALAKEKIGSPMLYDLIEYTKECLSDNNIPSCPCVICLEHFGKEEKFVKTECYHYFHSACLTNYVEHFLSESEDKTLVCPMCRLEIVYDKSDYTSVDNDRFSEEIFVYKPDTEQLKAQAERQRVFEHQKRKGGIINIEKEKNKFLIGIKDKKDEDNESNNFEYNRTSVPVVKEPSGTTALVLTAERYSDKNMTRDQIAKGKSDDENLKERKDGEGQKRIQVTERGNGGVNMDQSKNAVIPDSRDIADCGNPDTANEQKKNPTKLRKSGGYRKRKPPSSKESRNESRSQQREHNKALNEVQRSGAQRSLRNSPLPIDDSEKRSEESKDVKDQVALKNSRPDKTRRPEMQRNERNVNSEKKVGGLEGKFQMSFKEEAEQCKGQDDRSKDQANTVDGEKEWVKKCLTDAVKSSGVSSTLHAETKKSKENENDGIDISDKNNPRQVGSKQSLQTRKDDQKKSRSARTASSRRPRESDKPLEEKNTRKSYRSVASGTNQAQRTKRKDETVKRNDLPVSEKNQSASKSDKNFPRKAERTSSNFGDNNNGESVPPKRGPPPGFENFRPSGWTKEQKVASKESVQKASDPNDARVKASTRPPPGFENVKPNNRKV